MRQINVCVIGCGAIGALHAELYAQLPDVALTIVEQSPAIRKKLLAQGYTRVYESRSQIDAQADLYDICLPTHMHAGMLAELLQNSGAYILCEKPIVDTSAELRNLVSQEGFSDRVMCAMVERFHDPCRLMKAWAAEHSGPYELTFSRQTKPPVDGSWMYDPEQGGDILLDLGIHDIDLMLWLTGSSLAKVGEHSTNPNVSEHAELAFTDGSNAALDVGWNLPESHPFGIENHMTIRSSGGARITYDSTTETVLADGISTPVEPRFMAAYSRELQHAVQRAQTGVMMDTFPSPVELERGIVTVEAIMADRKSSR